MQQHVIQEMCLVRLAPSAPRRSDLVAVAREFGGRVVDTTPKATVIAVMDAPDVISAFIDRLAPFGIEAITRSGRLAMATSPALPGPTRERHRFSSQADGFADDEAAA